MTSTPPAQLAFEFEVDNASSRSAAPPAHGTPRNSESLIAAADVPLPLPDIVHAADVEAPPVERKSRSKAQLRARAAVLHARLQDMGLRNVEKLVLMRTRTVMVSLIGRTLRVNDGYADAPESVLRAIVLFASARSKAARIAARDVILAYEVEREPADRRVEPTRPGDEGIVLRLRAAHHELNVQWFGGSLTTIAIRLSSKMASRLGHFDPGTRFQPSEIVLSRKHVLRHGWREAMHTLLHEMVHQWQHETGRTVDHGREFRQRAREVGITPAARRDVTPVVSRRRRAG